MGFSINIGNLFIDIIYTSKVTWSAPSLVNLFGQKIKLRLSLIN